MAWFAAPQLYDLGDGAVAYGNLVALQRDCTSDIDIREEDFEDIP
jgi:hypothetical protein